MIVERIKPQLAEVISREQFGFLPNKHIHDAIGVSQECIHTSKIKKTQIHSNEVGFGKSIRQSKLEFIRVCVAPDWVSCRGVKLDPNMCDFISFCDTSEWISHEFLWKHKRVKTRLSVIPVAILTYY